MDLVYVQKWTEVPALHVNYVHVNIGGWGGWGGGGWGGDFEEWSGQQRAERGNHSHALPQEPIYTFPAI